MTNKFVLKLVASTFLSGAIATPALAAERELASYDFSGAAGTIPSGWTANTGFSLGRGYFEDSGRLDGNGKLVVSLVTYNSNSSHRTQFHQQGMKTNTTYSPPQGGYIRVTAKILIGHTQPGLVHGFFMYGERFVNSQRRQDELDFEWLTNETSLSSKNDNINVSSWNDWNISCGYNGTRYLNSCGQQTSQTVKAGKNTDGTAYQAYEMKWYSNGTIEFRVGGSTTTPVKTISGQVVPSGQALPVFLNSWAPDSSWTQAYNSGLVVASSNNTKRTYSMYVDELKIYSGT